MAAEHGGLVLIERGEWALRRIRGFLHVEEINNVER
jgi:hypothetical protein